MDYLTGRFHTVHGANATVQPRCGNQFEIILMTGKAAGNIWDVIERLPCANVEARCDAVSSSLEVSMSDTKAKKTNRRFKFKLPHVYTIMFLLIVVFAVLTWIVPSGQYQRKTISTAAGEREVAVAGTYEQVDKNSLIPRPARPSIWVRISSRSCKRPLRASRRLPTSLRSSY